MTSIKSAKHIRISNIYCLQFKKTLNDLMFQNTATNYTLAYTFLVLTTETYLSGLFPQILKWLSGKGRLIEIKSHSRNNRIDLNFNMLMLNKSINFAQELIKNVHERFDEFIEKIDFETRPRPFDVRSSDVLKKVYKNDQRSVNFLLKYNS